MSFTNEFHCMHSFDSRVKRNSNIKKDKAQMRKKEWKNFIALDFRFLHLFSQYQSVDLSFYILTPQKMTDEQTHTLISFYFGLHSSKIQEIFFSTKQRMHRPFHGSGFCIVFIQNHFNLKLNCLELLRNLQQFLECLSA